MKYRALLGTVAVLASLAGANSAQAGAEVGSWYVAPTAVYVDPDRLQRVITSGTAYKVGDAVGASFGIGKVLNQNWDAELNYVYSVHGAGSSTAATSYKSWEGMVNRIFLRDKRLSPFVGIGINSATYSLTHINSTVQANSSRVFGYLAKTGLIADVTKNHSVQIVAEMGWRAEGALKGTDKITLGEIRNFENTFFGLGLHYNFGAESATK